LEELSEQSTSYAPPITNDEISAVRSRYLGVDKERRVRKMSDEKFVFDWGDQDDTFNNASSALSATPGLREPALVMFGRGHLAGMDDGGAPIPQTDTPTHSRAGGTDDRYWTEKNRNP
jgi:ATP-dependent RNA helicase DDX23/PRP28